MNWTRAALSAGIAVGFGAAVIGLSFLAFSAPRAHEYQPAQDLAGLRCIWDYHTHTVAMSATIVNSRTEDQDYMLRVEYLSKAGKRVGSGDLIELGVHPGQTAAVTGSGAFLPGEVPDRCVIGLE